MAPIMLRWLMVLVSMFVVNHVSCILVPSFIRNSSLDDCITDATNLAAMGVIYNYYHVGKMMDKLATAVYDLNISQIHAENHKLTAESKSLLKRFGVDPSSILMSPVVQLIEKSLRQRPLVKDLDLDSVFENIRMLGVTLEKSYKEFKDCNDRNKGAFDAEIKRISNMYRVDLPKAWIGPLHNLYIKLGIDDSSIIQGEIYNRRVGLLGCERGSLVAAPGTTSEAFIGGHHHGVLLNTANNLIDRLFKAVRNNVPPESAASIERLYGLYHLNSSLGF